MPSLDAGGVVHIEAPRRAPTTAHTSTVNHYPVDQDAGSTGYQRVWRVSVLGEHLTDHDLTISVATDYEDSWGQTTTWTSDKLAAMPLEQGASAPAKQKCSAVRVRMQMKAPTGDGAFATTGKGAALYRLAIEWGQSGEPRNSRRLKGLKDGVRSESVRTRRACRLNEDEMAGKHAAGDALRQKYSSGPGGQRKPTLQETAMFREPRRIQINGRRNAVGPIAMLPRTAEARRSTTSMAT